MFSSLVFSGSYHIIFTMRDSNVFSVSTNTACVFLTEDYYSRQALDCTSGSVLLQSLYNLMLLTLRSAVVRQTLAIDGGLERLVAIMRECISDDAYNANNYFSSQPPNEVIDETSRAHYYISWKWSLAFECLRHTCHFEGEKVRAKIVSAGIIPILITIIDNYLKISKARGNSCEFNPD